MKLAQSRTFSPSKMPFCIIYDAPVRHSAFRRDQLIPAQMEGYLTPLGWAMQPLRGRAVLCIDARRAYGNEPGLTYSSPDNSAALPPAAAVLMVTVCSVAKRAR